MNFYDEKFLEIKKLFQEKKFYLVVQLIEAELKTPYLPKEFHRQILVFLEMAKQNLLPEKSFSFPSREFSKLFSLSQIKETLLSVDSAALHPYIFEHLSDYNLKILFPVFTIYLQTEKMTPSNKGLLINFLSQQKVNNFFLVVKNQKKIKINPFYLKPLEKMKIREKVFKILEKKLLSEEQTVFHITKLISEQFFTFFYPWIPYENHPRVIACAITYQGFLSLRKNVDLNLLTTSFNCSFLLVQKLHQILVHNKFF